MVTKTDNENYVISTIKIYGHISFVFCCAKVARVVENTECDVATLKIVTAMQKSQIIIFFDEIWSY